MSDPAHIPGIPQNLWAAPEDKSINLAWSPSAPDLTLQTTYHVRRSLTKGGPYTLLASTTNTNYADTGLTNGTTYYYVVSAANVNGESANSSEVFAVPQLIGQHDWQTELEYYLAAGPAALSMALCTENAAPIRILLNKIERARFTPLGIFQMHPLFAPSVRHQGFQWNDVNQQTFMDYPAHVQQSRVGCLFTQISGVTVDGSLTSEQSFIGTGIGTVRLPVNFFVPGKMIRLRAFGYYTTSGATDFTLSFKIDNEIVSVDVTGIAAATNKAWQCDVDLTCLTKGVTGTVIAQGRFSYDTKTAGMVNTAATTFDTTAIGHIDLTGTFSAGVGGNFFKCTNLSLEVLN